MILDFCRAYIKAFQHHGREFIWTNDGAVRTTVMQSYIYPFLAKYLGYYLVCECPADAAFFRADKVQDCLRTGQGYPRGEAILLEHENNPAGVSKEMGDLAQWNAPLNVLITYPTPHTCDDQGAWLNKEFKPELKPDANKYLVILPSADYGEPGNPFNTWWCFFKWDPRNHAFVEIQIIV